MPPICNGTLEQRTTNFIRLQIFGKAKKDLQIFPATKDALELHTTRAYQAENKEHIYVPLPVATEAWNKDAESLTAV